MAIIFEWKNVKSDEEVKPGTTRKVLALGRGLQIIRYDKEPGGVTPEHNHPEELIGILIQGKQEAVLNGKKVTILPGMGYYIPANEKHGPFTNVSNETCISLDIVSPPRTVEAYKAKR